MCEWAFRIETILACNLIYPRMLSAGVFRFLFLNFDSRAIAISSASASLLWLLPPRGVGVLHFRFLGASLFVAHRYSGSSLARLLQGVPAPGALGQPDCWRCNAWPEAMAPSRCARKVISGASTAPFACPQQTFIEYPCSVKLCAALLKIA